MSTSAQSAANLENAQHSTGPRTEEGKAASSQNALKHGLTAKTVLLPGEDEAAYRQLCEGLHQTLGPANELERSLVQLLCIAQWRIDRCARIEALILSPLTAPAPRRDAQISDNLDREQGPAVSGSPLKAPAPRRDAPASDNLDREQGRAVSGSVAIPDFKALDNMSKHEARLKREYSATLKEVRSLIDARIAKEEAEMNDAKRIRRADQMAGCDTDLQEIGFVFSTAEVDAAILREDTLKAAKQMLSFNRAGRMDYSLKPDVK